MKPNLQFVGLERRLEPPCWAVLILEVDCRGTELLMEVDCTEDGWLEVDCREGLIEVMRLTVDCKLEVDLSKSPVRHSQIVPSSRNPHSIILQQKFDSLQAQIQAQYQLNSANVAKLKLNSAQFSSMQAKFRYICLNSSSIQINAASFV